MSEHIPHLEFLYTRFLTCLLESSFFFHKSKVSVLLSTADVSCIKWAFVFFWDLAGMPSKLSCLSLQLLLCSYKVYCFFSVSLQWFLFHMPHFPLESNGLWVLTLFIFSFRWFFFKYLQDTKDSKRAFPSSCFLSLGYFAAPEVLGTSLSDTAFYCFLSLLESTLSVCVPVLITLKLPFKDFPVVIIEAFRGRGCLSPNTKHSGHQLLPAWLF